VLWHPDVETPGSLQHQRVEDVVSAIRGIYYFKASALA